MKDPNSPSRPLSAYFRWMQIQRPIVKAEFPTLPHKELTKKLGVLWKEVDAAEKETFQDAAKIDMEEWKKKMKKYKETDEYKHFQETKKAQNIQKMKSKKFPSDKNAPKRPSTGFFLFVAAKRPEVKESLPIELQNKVTEITKKCGELWRGLGDEGQAEWKAQAQKAKDVYNVKLAAYKKTDQYKDYMARKTEFKKKQKKLLEKAKRKARKQASESSSSDSSSDSDTSSSSWEKNIRVRGLSKKK